MTQKEGKQFSSWQSLIICSCNYIRFEIILGVPKMNCLVAVGSNSTLIEQHL